MRDLALTYPLANAIQEEVVGKVLAPDAAVFHAHFRQRPVEVEQADQTWPFTAPVGNGQDRSSMAPQPGQHMMAILPYGLGHNKRSVGRDVLEHIHAHTLI